MTESIIKQYMAANDLNQNQITAAAGLVRNSIRRQVEVGFDGITMRTVKLLANVLEKTPQQVFDDLYQLAGGINDYSEEAGIYDAFHYEMDETSHTLEANPSGDSFGLHQAIGAVKLLAERGAGENERIDVAGGTDMSAEDNNEITISILPDGVKYKFAALSNEAFKTMWRETFKNELPEADEW